MFFKDSAVKRESFFIAVFQKLRGLDFSKPLINYFLINALNNLFVGIRII